MALTTNPGVVMLFEELLKQAQRGAITEAFVWYRLCDESCSHEYLVEDVDDMLYELGTVILTERITK